MNFLIFTIVIGLSCSLITIRTLVSYSDVRPLFKVLVSFFILVSWFAPALTSLLRKLTFLNGSSYSFLYTLGYALFGFAFILFALLFVRDILWYLGFGISKISALKVIDPKDGIALYKANIVASVIAVVLSLYAFYEGTKIPPFKEVVLHSDKIKQETTFAVITDLHINRAVSAERVRTIVEKTNALNPQAILLVGDIIDDTDNLDEQIAELAKLKAKDGVFMVLGNHEVYRGASVISRKIKEIGFKFLFNEGEEISNNIFIAGIPDYLSSAYVSSLTPNIRKTLQNSKDENYKILLSHSPSFIDTLDNGKIDLQLSGHTHGGQIFPFHLGVKRANHYLAGLYDTNGMKLYVSRGSGTWGPQMRLLAPSEVTIIKLEP